MRRTGVVSFLNWSEVVRVRLTTLMPARTTARLSSTRGRRWRGRCRGGWRRSQRGTVSPAHPPGRPGAQKNKMFPISLTQFLRENNGWGGLVASLTTAACSHSSRNNWPGTRRWRRRRGRRWWGRTPGKRPGCYKKYLNSINIKSFSGKTFFSLTRRRLAVSRSRIWRIRRRCWLTGPPGGRRTARTACTGNAKGTASFRRRDFSFLTKGNPNRNCQVKGNNNSLFLTLRRRPLSHSTCHWESSY